MHPLGANQWNKNNFSIRDSGNLRRSRAGAYQRNVSMASLPLMACWALEGYMSQCGHKRAELTLQNVVC